MQELERVSKKTTSSSSMKQVFLERGHSFLYDVPIPTLTAGQVVVKVHYSFISSGTESAIVRATEKSFFKKAAKNFSKNLSKVSSIVKESGVYGALALVQSKLNQLVPVGYSCSGQVISVGENVDNFKVGDFVACAGAGVANHAEIVVVPKNLVVKLSNTSYLKEASITTIGAIALQGVRRAELQLGERVAVIGLGLLGQLTVQLAKLAGCEVFGVDIVQSRTELAASLGCDIVIDASAENVEDRIAFATRHVGVDKTIITAASSSGEIIQQAMRLTRKKGRVVLVGDVKLDFDRDPFYSKEIDFLISCSYGPGRYDYSYEYEGHDYPLSYVRWTENRNMELFCELIEKRKIKISPLISAEYHFDKVEDAYASLKTGSPLGIVLSYGNWELGKSGELKFLERVYKDLKLEKNSLFAEDAKEYVPPHGEVKVGIVGVGGFARLKLLPILSKLKNVDIHSVVDSNVASSINVARQYGAKRFATDYRKILIEGVVDLVVIATPHKFHTEQALAFLQNGKAVFVEKPAAVTFEQLDKLKEFFARNKKFLYCVDFNRSFAPFNLAIKKELAKRVGPVIINYRMNSGYLSKDHWIQSKSNGGRIIGEACHIFELFISLTNTVPVTVSVSSVNSNREDIFSTDNFVASLTMSDGSVCTLTYTAVGSSAMEKERMEIFFDGKSIVMDNYLSLEGFGLPESFNKTTRSANKGHKELLSAFIKAASNGGESPLSLKRILMATEISLVVDKLVREGGCCEKFVFSENV